MTVRIFTFYKSLGVTAYYVLLSVPLQIIFAFCIALVLNANIKGRSIFRTIFYLPTIVPAVASSIVWMMMFDPDTGILNAILHAVHLPASRWIYDEKDSNPLPCADESVDCGRYCGYISGGTAECAEGIVRIRGGGRRELVP